MTPPSQLGTLDGDVRCVLKDLARSGSVAEFEACWSCWKLMYLKQFETFFIFEKKRHHSPKHFSVSPWIRTTLARLGGKVGSAPRCRRCFCPWSRFVWSRRIVQSNPQSNGSKSKGHPSFQENYFTFQTFPNIFRVKFTLIYLHPILEITTSGSFLSFSLLCSWLASMTIGSPLVPCPKRRIHVDDTDGSRYGKTHVLWKIHILSYMICIVASSIIFFMPCF